MSFLYPLLLAGITAVAMPIALHMIRRHTRKRMTFSSLIFLRTTVPRLRNRDRLEHIPLLILRCLILCLLAFAFARPFLPRSIAAKKSRPGQRLVVLIDTSASMRRVGLWKQAVQEAQLVLGDTHAADRACLMTFDQSTRTVFGFDEWEKMDLPQRGSVAIRSLAGVSPGWGATNLGQALVAAAEVMEDDEVNDGEQAQGVRRVILISDLQQGSDLTALPAHEWPEGTELAIKTVSPQNKTNASLQLVITRDSPPSWREGDLPSIRISNAADADKNRFQLCWADSQSRTSDRERPKDDDTRVSAGGAMDVYVPAGQSIVVQAPPKPDSSGATRLVLTGDDHDFDNTLYVAPPLGQRANILYVGNDDPNDAQAMLYYVRKAFGIWSTSPSQVTPKPAGDILREADIAAANLVIVADVIPQSNIALLRRHIESGGAVLLVMRSAEATETLSGLSRIGNLESREAELGRYAMLTSIDFEHPLFAPFSDPRFGDFTRIHFWKHRRVSLGGRPQIRVLARFDNDKSREARDAALGELDPAWFEVAVGQGVLLVSTSGWHRSDSDLALSSKFVPLLYAVLEQSGTLTDRRLQYFVGDPVSIPARTSPGAATTRIRRPDSSIVNLDATQQAFVQTDLPGIYSIESATEDRDFAVNLFPAESRTEPMAVEDIERMGISLEPVSDVAPGTIEQTTQHGSFAQMESEQKLWRWVLIATLAMLLIEIWLGGWLIRPGTRSEGERP